MIIPTEAQHLIVVAALSYRPTARRFRAWLRPSPEDSIGGEDCLSALRLHSVTLRVTGEATVRPDPSTTLPFVLSVRRNAPEVEGSPRNRDWGKGTPAGPRPGANGFGSFCRNKRACPEFILSEAKDLSKEPRRAGAKPRKKTTAEEVSLLPPHVQHGENLFLFLGRSFLLGSFLSRGLLLGSLLSRSFLLGSLLSWGFLLGSLLGRGFLLCCCQ